MKTNYTCFLRLRDVLTTSLQNRPFSLTYSPTNWNSPPPGPLRLLSSTSEYTIGASDSVITADTTIDIVTAIANRSKSRFATLERKSIGIKIV